VKVDKSKIEKQPSEHKKRAEEYIPESATHASPPSTPAESLAAAADQALAGPHPHPDVPADAAVPDHPHPAESAAPHSPHSSASSSSSHAAAVSSVARWTADQADRLDLDLDLDLALVLAVAVVVAVDPDALAVVEAADAVVADDAGTY
jgi:hypothetical protein